MLPGVDGHLVSAACLEAELAAGDDADVDRARRTFERVRSSAADLGPASPVRAVLELAGARLARVLEFAPPSRSERADRLISATLQTGEASVVHVVIIYHGAHP